MRLLLTAALLTSLAADASAQDPGAAPVGERRPATAGAGRSEPGDAMRSLRTTAAEHDEARSRALFAACDADADDRLDLFEARAALRAPASPREIGWFRRLDHDRDGFVDWPEFDRHFQDVVQSGASLHLSLVRPVRVEASGPGAAGTTPIAEAEPSRLSFAMFDTDKNGKLDATEVQALLQKIGAPPSAAAMLPLLDANQDKALSEAELAPALNQFAPGLFGPAAPTKAADVPVGVFADLDTDGNGAVTVQELGSALRRVDPQLERWAEHVHKRLDRNGDRVLRAAELPAPTAARREAATRPQAMVEPGTKR